MRIKRKFRQSERIIILETNSEEENNGWDNSGLKVLIGCNHQEHRCQMRSNTSPCMAGSAGGDDLLQQHKIILVPGNNQTFCYNCQIILLE